MLVDLSERLDHRILRARGFTSGFVPTSVGRIHAYEARGDRPFPPLVVLHGVNNRASTFRAVLLGLRRDLGDVIAPDLPGHGLSDVPLGGMAPEILEKAIVESLDALIRRPAVLFGNSMGGLVAIRYALARPERVRGLFLASPAGAPMDEAEFQRFLRSFDLADWRSARAFLDRMFADPPWYTALVANEMRSRFERPAIRDFVRQIRSRHLLADADLRALRTPLVVWWGREDGFMPASNREFFRSHLPEGAVFEEPEGFGHCPHFDRPALLAARIASFVRSLEPG